jgi:hypothetical protein
MSALLFGAAALAIANVYYDNKLLSIAIANKKYLHMAAIAGVAGVVYYLLTHMPAYANKIITSTHECLKYIPVSIAKTGAGFGLGIASGLGQDSGFAKTVRMNSIAPEPVFANALNRGASYDAKAGGGGATKPACKRSVSETKKKYVASSQAWHCGNCKQMLNHTFEIDHRVALNQGGTNDTHNLVALCPLCHREKTARDIMREI